MSKRETPKKVDGETYSESNYWSQRHKFWKSNYVAKPRLPSEFDETNRWITKYVPSSIRHFRGSNNNEICNTLRSLGDSFDAHRTFPASLIIHGANGSGKSALVTAFLQELCDSLRLDTTKQQSWLLKFDGKKCDASTVVHRIQRFDEIELKEVKIGFKMIVIDDADCIPPSVQQTMKIAFEGCIGSYRYIYVCREISKLISHFQTKSHPLRTKRMPEKDALSLVLSILVGERVGFEREGVKRLFALNSNQISLTFLLDTAQDVFRKFHFISEENVQRFHVESLQAAAGYSSDQDAVHQLLPEVLSTVAVMPLPRCEICTLFPPCSHKTLQQISDEGTARRKQLPNYRGGLVCPEFYRFGRCSVFNATGRCSLSHPQHIHHVVEISRRCPQCTLVWPCAHCNFSADRSTLVDTINRLKKRLTRLKKIAVPHPPRELIVDIAKHYPEYKAQLGYLRKTYIDNKQFSVLTKTEEWLEGSLCTDKTAYISRHVLLTSSFQEIFESPLLDVAPKIATSSSPDDFLRSSSSIEMRRPTETSVPRDSPSRPALNRKTVTSDDVFSLDDSRSSSPSKNKGTM